MNEVPFHKIFEIPLRNGLTRPSSVRGAGISFVNMGEIFAYDRLSNQNMELVQVSEAEKSKYLLRSGDLLFARQSLKWDGAGKVSIFVGSSETTFESHLIRARLNSKIADPRFYYYFFRSSAGRTVMESIIEQVAAAGIRGSDLANLPVPLPPLSYQRQVADTLWAFEDKIDHNQLQCGLLEEMSQALFKSWFVDFDPVVAKLEGRKPFGMSDDIAALFPDSFEESELGAVPKGWRVVETGHITDIQNGFAFKSDWWRPQGTPVVKIGSVKSGYVDVADASYLDSSKAAEFQAYELEEGDILIGLTGYPGEVGLVPRSIPKPLLNQRVGKFTPKRGIYRSFVYTMTRQSEFREQVEQRAHGTAQLNVSTGGILSIKCVIPSEGLFEVFDELVRPMITKILNCFAESSQLSKARDMLLPELLGGGINETAHVTEPTAA